VIFRGSRSEGRQGHRTGGVDQAHVIARELNMQMHFHPALRVLEELYGDAILSTLPLRLVRAAGLPRLRRWPGLEPRGAIWSSIDIGGTHLRVINTHLGLLARERLAQVDAFWGPNGSGVTALEGHWSKRTWARAWRPEA
jgi:endonuclease/exonuclease/phosphatase family metal-dependent hydrolase